MLSHRLVIVGFGMALLASCSMEDTNKGSGQNGLALVVSPEIVSGDIGFQVETESLWHVPKEGSATDIRIGLKLTNHGRSEISFHLFETVRPMITPPGGTAIESHFARDARKRGNAISSGLQPGQSTTLAFPAKLTRRADGLFNLSGDDGFGGTWAISGFDAGAVSFAIRYVNNDIPASGQQVWTGDIRTSPVSVGIK